MMTKLLTAVITLCAISAMSCAFHNWNTWSVCSVECGTGIKSRERIAKRKCGYSEIIQKRSCTGKCERGIILSRGKSVEASSSFVPTYKTSMVTDGNKNNDLFAGKSCFMTDKDAKPWIRIDLGSPYPVVEVILYNRGDCCSTRLNNVQVTIGNNKDGAKNTFCAKRHNMAKENVTRMFCFKPLDGRFVTISIPGPQFLALCEVEVHGYGVLRPRTATASNTYSSYKATKAIDRNVNTFYRTSRSGNYWWTADLGKVAMIYEVIIRAYGNNSNYIGGGTVYVVNGDKKVKCATIQGGKTNRLKGNTAFVYRLKCANLLKGRYVQIQKTSGYLFIREFQAVGYFI